MESGFNGKYERLNTSQGKTKEDSEKHKKD